MGDVAGQGPGSEVESTLVRARLRQRLNGLVTDSARIIVAGAALLYTVFAVGNYFVVPADVHGPLVMLCASSALLLWALLGLLAWRMPPPRWGHPIVVGVGLVILVNIVGSSYLPQNLDQSSHIMLVMLAAGFVLLSRAWLAVMLALCWIAAGLLAWFSAHESSYMPMTLIATSLLAGSLHLTRVAAIRRLEHLRLQEERQARKLAAAVDDLSQSNREKNELLGMAAHDLRSPLVVIHGISELLLNESPGPLTAKQRKFVGMVARSSEFMTSLMSDLLDISTIESGTLRLRTERKDYVAFAEEVVQFNRQIAGDREIDIALSAAEGIGTLEIDPNKIEQVLNNLLGNAIKFSTRGAAISVEIEARNGVVVTRVEDQGAGIPAEELDQIFKPFKKARSHGDDGAGSTGLGLAIAKRIVESHRGEIGVESALGRGAVFWFSLPET